MVNNLCKLALFGWILHCSLILNPVETFSAGLVDGGEEYIDRESYPSAYGILTSESLMYPVDMSDWPVKIDERHQLFVDNYLIASSTGLHREYHQPEKHPQNPLIVKTEPWEENSIIPDVVLRDEQTGKFRMWYTTRLVYTEPGGKKVRFPTLYAESADGIVWEKPKLGLIEHEGSKENNFLIHAGRISGLFVDEKRSDPNKKYTALVWHEPEYVETEGYFLYHSPDGLRWEGDRERCLIPNMRSGYTMPQQGIGDTTIFRYDSLLDRYVCSVKFVLPDDRIGKMRCRGHCESDDLIHWTRPRFTIYPDEHDDADAQIYGNIEFPYESLWLGLLRVMYEARAGYKQVEVQLSYSRDGRTWSRPREREVFLPFGGPDSWEPDYTDPVHNVPIRVGDELWFYYRGSRHSSRGGIEASFSYSSMEVGLATLRLDGFVSINAGTEPGKVITRPLTIEGGSLFVNAEIEEGGWIKAGLLTGNYEPITGCVLEECVPAEKGDLAVPMTWEGSRTIPFSDEEPRRIVFELSKANLYSFWFR